MSLREEIFDIINSSMNCYEDSHAMQPDTEDKILKAIEKRIDSIMQREITDSHHQQLKNDLSTTDAIVRICREIKEILK